jgi:carboxypeptidase Q
MTAFHRLASILLTTAIAAAPAAAQTFRTDEPVMRRIWSLGMDSSQVERLAQVLNDSIGMRLSGTTGFQSAVDWLLGTYRSWGVSARAERYGTALGWHMGTTDLALIAPRTQSLDATPLAWTPGTGGQPVEGDAVILPLLADTAEATRWLATVRGKFVLLSAPEIMCRAQQELERNARPETVTRINERRTAVQRDWSARVRAFGGSGTLNRRLQESGVAGLLTLFWSGGWGVNKIHGAPGARVPVLDVACEHYGSIWRLAANNQGPRLRLTSDAATPPDQPMFNVIAELRGSELPNEYVLLMAHLDSWHGATGATDNGTGTLTMLEAMRILAQAYPRPRRTILVGHWGAEEQGLIGSRSFGEDHPEVLAGLQAAFNQDNGTWRFEILEGQGFAGSTTFLPRWMARLPTELSSGIRLEVPGPQNNPGSDHSAFICHGVPTFRLQSPYDEYRQYTWHTNRDTYDKIVFDDLRMNATVAAMLAYAASEDRERFPRDRAALPPGPNGQPRSWPTCAAAQRNPPR